VGSNPTPGIVRRIREDANVRSSEDLAAVKHLLQARFNDCEISRRTGIPRGTVQTWRSTGRPFAQREVNGCATCGHDEHDFAALPGPDYTYLLGLYLGDGHIVHQHRGV
jgi:hypothetical protein